ncbi:MAG TPA: ammonia-forming cytochrome c nitrite reductase subunit c552, partial [Kofleriaceae bacterium]|nr:ammonia-forming cytochrome c nitrite reductase subunit c552 [Kofleriaceae bacterium]
MKQVLVFVLVIAAAGCGDDGNLLSIDELMDPETCRDCHPKHFREWQGSMHAYAAEDPVFIAMNRRGQEETGGELGDFCVNCHAPMAVRLGLTTDGLNLDELPAHVKGVTCYFCHSVTEVAGDHNNPLVLANDGVLRGGLIDPVDNGVHKMAYSPLHASGSQESSAMCGSCHDIVTPAGVHLERTFSEWKESLFSKPHAMGGRSCNNCHMPFVKGTAADFPGVPLRDVREHMFIGVDVALTEWPEKEAQLAGIAR